MSVSHSEPAEPAGASDLDEWKALRWRELPWVALPHPIKVSVVPYLMVQEVGRLDSAMTNREARPHLWESYRGMQSPAFNAYKYEYRSGRGGDHEELQWARKRGIDLRGFTLGLGTGVRCGSGRVLVELMGGSKGDLNLDIATYYATRGRLTGLEEVIKLGNRNFTALTCASEKGHLEIVKCLLAAGADTEKAHDEGRDEGWTALSYATDKGHHEIVQLLNQAASTT